MPTPLVDDAKNTGHNTNRYATLASVAYNLPTPTARDYKDGSKPRIRNGEIQTDSLGRAVTNGDLGKYQQAVRRWEQTINVTAPPATIPDGRDGNYRLNPEFSEWLMGIPQRLDGVGLTRTERLKMAGNGVCPQQAEAALTILLERLKNE